MPSRFDGFRRNDLKEDISEWLQSIVTEILVYYLWTTVVHCYLRIMTCIFLLQKIINGLMHINQKSALPTNATVYIITQWISPLSLFYSSKRGRGTVASTPVVMSDRPLMSGGS